MSHLDSVQSTRKEVEAVSEPKKQPKEKLLLTQISFAAVATTRAVEGERLRKKQEFCRLLNQIVAAG